MTTDCSVLLDKELKELELKFRFNYQTATGIILFASVLYLYFEVTA